MFLNLELLERKNPNAETVRSQNGKLNSPFHIMCARKSIENTIRKYMCILR